MRIAFFDTKPYDEDSFRRENRDFGFDITFFNMKLHRDTAVLARDYDVVCVFVNDRIDEDVLDLLVQGKTRLIALRCAGYNNVDLKYAYGKIHVVHVPAYSPYAVAEHAAALLLTLNRKTHRAHLRTREMNFTLNGLTGMDLYGKTAGVIGMGKIGERMVSILSGFGMKILAYDKFPRKELEEKYPLSYATLEELYRNSDVITLHCPLTPETVHLISSEAIEMMKDGVFLINTSRGKLINTKALIGGLKSRKIGAAGLDVYEEESEYFFEDYSNQVISDDNLARLLTFPNVLITSHQGFLTQEALDSIAGTTLANIRDFTEEKDLPNEICYQCGREECRKSREGRCF